VVRLRRLLSPGLVVSSFLGMVPFLAWSTMDLGLMLWLTGPTFELSVVAATGIFTLMPVGYLVGTIPAGWATDKTRRKKLVVALGLVFSGAVYLLFSPRWTESDGGSHVTLIGVLMVVGGVACPLVMVPVLPDMHECRATPAQRTAVSHYTMKRKLREADIAVVANKIQHAVDAVSHWVLLVKCHRGWG
jgi:MFS family permease